MEKAKIDQLKQHSGGKQPATVTSSLDDPRHTTVNLSSDYHVKVYKDFNSAGHLKEEWDRFVELENAGIFMTFDWLKTWLLFYGQGCEARIYIILKGSDWVGAVPLIYDSIGIPPFNMRVARIMGTDYVPVTIKLPIGRVHLPAVVDLVLKAITEDLSCDAFHIGPLAGDYMFYKELCDSIERSSSNDYLVFKRESGVQTYYNVCGSVEEQLSKLGKQERKKIRRAYRDVDRLDLRLEFTYADEENVEKYLQDFIDMHQKKWQKEGRPGHFVAWPASAEFHKEVAIRQAKLGRLRLMRIQIDDRAVGYKYAYKHGNTFYVFLDARTQLTGSRNLHFYRLAFVALIRDAIMEGSTRIDLMRGSYKHKLRLGGKELPTHDIFLCRKGRGRLLRLLLLRSYAWMLNLTYYKIWRARLAPWINARPKPLLNSWIRFYPMSF